MKLLIAMPSLDYMSAETTKALTHLVMHLKDEGVDFSVSIEAGTLVYMARDRLACKAINQGYTHVLWIDADMVFTEELLEDLQFSGKDFVTGIAVSRRKPFSSCLFKSTDLEHLERWGDVDTMPKNTFEIAGCGFACVLISVDILKAVQLRFGTCFTPMNSYGEDIAFCRRAKELGYRIFAEPAVKVGHIGHLAIFPDDVEHYRDDWAKKG